MQRMVLVCFLQHVATVLCCSTARKLISAVQQQTNSTLLCFSLTMAKKSSSKPPPKGHAVPSDPYADFPKNNKGKYMSWRSGTPAADTLKVLVHGGALDGMTAGQIQKDENYKQFNK